MNQASPVMEKSVHKDVMPEVLDVVILGAGISGIGAAYHLSRKRPGTRFAVLEMQESFGGTWLTHRYPGVRSDSDLYTFGYEFKPWKGKPIATGQEILDYLREVIEENDLEHHIRYGHRVLSANWSSIKNRWMLEVLKSTGERTTIEAKFLWMCQGYYRHSKGYTPQWEGLEDYRGQIVHPQTWPDDIDLDGKKVVVVGSGASAATIIPAIADKCAHVTMLQRSPGYYRSARNHDELADFLRKLEIDETWIHEIVRRKILLDQHSMAKRTFAEPDEVREELLAGVRAHLGSARELEEHFTPTYRPWSQRILFVPDGDLFSAIRAGKVAIVTDHIERFTATGLQLRSGQFLDADVVITATGFNLSVMGDIPFHIDGSPLNFSDTVTYRGMMFSDVPNLLWVFGYFRAAWTMRADMISRFACRLLEHMDEKGSACVTPKFRPEDTNMKLLPWISPANFNPGYLSRSMHLMPKSGDHEPWANSQDYWSEKDEFENIDLDERALVYL